ncbi:hypothetical protein [Nitrosomonas marina]|uniref:Uncharacterized protein n=1 Tax=Nitrosomonas marina TaxID=917 RepID=A0A1H8J3J4_9PROT|nr:hypothetical protein [Nitrosomonas marina]SEN75211.1 hypothetical protein SAMN05216325_1522 [Nitrosomonas marina]
MKHIGLLIVILAVFILSFFVVDIDQNPQRDKHGVDNRGDLLFLCEDECYRFGPESVEN